jgi:transcriptional regulator with XRE-family HTH domain
VAPNDIGQQRSPDSQGRVLAFRQLLRGHRTARRLTQVGLAFRAGLSQSSISALESGKRRPNPSQIAALSAALALNAVDMRRLYASGGFLPDEDETGSERVLAVSLSVAEAILRELLTPSTYQASMLDDIRQRVINWRLLHQAVLASWTRAFLTDYLVNMIVASEERSVFHRQLVELQDALANQAKTR